jgi:regulator of replication initiation timing
MITIGTLLVIAILFGLVLSMHQRCKRIYDDLQLIKQKLGIEEKDEFNMKNEEIERELEDIYQKSKEDEGKTKT